MKKQLIINVLQKDRRRKFSLIERYYPYVMAKEFVVAIFYNKKLNTYQDGIITLDIIEAYKIFNYLVNNSKLPSNE